MNKGHTLTVFVALFGIALLFAGSACAAVDFPADEAGISAYVKANDSITIDDVKPAFATTERETDDYIIGTVAMSGHSEEQCPHVYVSTDGWVVAYYPDDRSSGWLLPWHYYSGGDISTTTLNETIVKVCDQINGTATGLKYYDFRHPDATKMMIIVESTTGSNWFNITIPTSFATSAVDWSHYASTYYSGGGYGWSNAYIDGNCFNSFGVGHKWAYGSLLGQFDNGVEHKIQIVTDRGTGRIGLVLEYAD